MPMKNEKKETVQLNNKHGMPVFIIACAVILIVVVAGLWYLSGEGRKPGDLVAFTVGESEVYMDEVNLYCLENMVNLGISSKDLDETTASDGTSANDYYKNEIMELIIDNKISYQKACKEGVTLTKDEEAKIESDVSDYMGRIKGTILSEYGITRDTIYNSYRERYMANKQIQAVKDEVTVEDQRYCTLYMLMFPKVYTDESGQVQKDDSGAATLLPEDEIQQRKKDADEAYSQLLEGADIEEVAKKYGVEAFSGEESNLEDSFGDKFNSYAKTLKAGEYSPVIDADSSFVIIKMVEENNQALADQILSYYKADVEKEAVEKAVEEWYTQFNVSRGHVMPTSSFKRLSLYDFTKYAEE